MRRLFLFVLLFLSIGVLAQQELRIIKWQKIVGWKHPEVVAYFDVYSLRRDTSDGRDFGYGMILFHRDYPVEVTVQGNTATATDFARYFIVDCDKAMIAVVTEYYFNLNHLPLITDKLVYAVDYSEQTPEPKDISKSDPVYKTLCPKYI
jgi:hypothetical protein